MMSSSKPGKKSRIKLFDLVRYLDDTLVISDFAADASANGLQFEGSGVVRKVAVAVDACQAVIDAAAVAEADLLLVHHGLIWGGLRSITGSLKSRFSSLVRHDTSLYSCHLPLDAHPILGNNARILKALSVKKLIPFGTYHGKKIGFQGALPKAVTLDAFVKKLDRITGGSSTVVDFFSGKVKHVAVVSGGGADCISEVERSLVDTYITGEPSHAAFLQAEEMEKNIVFAGHYATETFGVRAVGDLLSKQFGLDVVFIEHPTKF